MLKRRSFIKTALGIALATGFSLFFPRGANAQHMGGRATGTSLTPSWRSRTWRSFLYKKEVYVLLHGVL